MTDIEGAKAGCTYLQPVFGAFKGGHEPSCGGRDSGDDIYAVTYEDEVDVDVRDAWLADHEMLDLSMSEADKSERYIKFKDVTFGIAPKEHWPSLMKDLLALEHGIAGT